jgi:hypothetical protein
LNYKYLDMILINEALHAKFIWNWNSNIWGSFHFVDHVPSG